MSAHHSLLLRLVLKLVVGKDASVARPMAALKRPRPRFILVGVSVRVPLRVLLRVLYTFPYRSVRVPLWGPLIVAL